jgi:hypothetical protein
MVFESKGEVDFIRIIKKLLQWRGIDYNPFPIRFVLLKG